MYVYVCVRTRIFEVQFNEHHSTHASGLTYCVQGGRKSHHYYLCDAKLRFVCNEKYVDSRGTVSPFVRIFNVCVFFERWAY